MATASFPAQLTGVPAVAVIHIRLLAIDAEVHWQVYSEEYLAQLRDIADSGDLGPVEYDIEYPCEELAA